MIPFIVVFNSLEWETNEFTSTLIKCGFTHKDFCHVADYSKSFYNDYNSYTDISHRIHNSIKHMVDRPIYFLGGSMGGFGASLFANNFSHCKKVLMFSPRMAHHHYIDSDLFPGKQYFRTFAKKRKILHHSFITRSDVEYVCYYGKYNRTDRLAAEELSKTCKNLILEEVDTDDHRTPKILKARGLLTDAFKKHNFVAVTR